jgi:hypothetical protein
MTIITGGLAIWNHVKKPAVGAKPLVKPPRDTPARAVSNRPPSQVTPSPTAGVVEIRNDDAAYRKWLTDHPVGFVVNTARKMAPDYMVLHRAACPHVGNFDSHQSGAFTERDFIKIVADDVSRLREWTKKHGRADGSFSTECGVCHPT